MSIECPIGCISCTRSGKVVGYGKYYRKSDRRIVKRYKCTHCQKHFSQATNSACIHQNKRHLNLKIKRLLVSGVSQRRISRLLKIHMITVARKLSFLGLQARHQNLTDRIEYSEISEFQFDDLESFEHTKLKPLSITLAVEKQSRYIVGFEVARMPAKGLLARRSIKKYGPRKEERTVSRERLFRRIQRGILENCVVESDQNPHYPPSVRKYFPKSVHLTTPGQRGCVTGQGELKRVEFDPLFSLNHTCAMLRANINRLFRKTWCTTKKIQPLIDHIELYVNYHNRVLLETSKTGHIFREEICNSQ